MSILTATDCSDASRAAVATAARLARDHDRRLTVANFVEESVIPTWGPRLERPDDVEAQLRSNARERLETFWGEFDDEIERPDEVELRVDVASPTDAIPAMAREEDFELVVVGATGLNRVAEWLVGSTAESVVRGSDAPVLVVPPETPDAPFERILAPVDFSACSRRSLRAAADLARDEGAALQILHSYIPPTADVSSLSPTVTPERVEQIEREQREQFETFVDSFDLDDLPVQQTLEVGPPHDTIAETDADLIVMGTHGRRGFERFFLGSTASKVLRRMPCAVMTVRSHDDD